MKKRDKKILVALGFDESPESVLSKAADFCEMLNAKMYVMHVITEMPKLDFYFDAYRLWEEFRESALKESMDILNKYIERFRGKHPDIEAIVDSGEPASKIVEKADELDADMIIMGHHVRKGLNHFLHLNTCEHVVRFSKRPILSFYVE